jgi:hypothetical protein
VSKLFVEQLKKAYNIDELFILKNEMVIYTYLFFTLANRLKLIDFNVFYSNGLKFSTMSFVEICKHIYY